MQGDNLGAEVSRRLARALAGGDLDCTLSSITAELGVGDPVVAHQSAIALEFARHISDLEHAVESRQSIGHAVGESMEHLDLDDARALAFLARVSQQDATGKFRVTAEELLHDALARHAHPREHCAACPTPWRVPIT